MNKYPIFIPSKKRSNNCLTAELLKKYGVYFSLVVEPQESQLYNIAFPESNILVLDKNDAGLAFSRQSILEYARKKGLDWFWMIDDDINNFFMTKNKKNFVCNPAEALSYTEFFTEKNPGLSSISIEYQQYAWSAAPRIIINSYQDCVVLFNVKNIKVCCYDDAVIGKEDRDFVLQYLTKGFNNARITKYSFDTPKNGSNKGGLHDFYLNKKEEQASFLLSEKWPNYCQPITKSDGRKDVFINWKKFKRDEQE